MSDKPQDEAKSAKHHVQPADVDGWGDMIDTMHDYLSTLREHAEAKKTRAATQLEQHEAQLDELKREERKRRNYGTRTGIILKGETIEEDE